MNNRYVVWLCALFVLFDLGYSYIQNYQIPLEFAAIFMNADKLRMTNNNQCERAALQQLAQSPEPIVHLDSDCTVMAWEKITDPLQSDNNAQLLELWGVTKGKKLYYQ